MAHMYPETLEGLEVQSHAEIKLFEAFRQQLSDHFSVIHSVAWLGIRRPGAPPADGEADFVILHPNMGVLVLEVKGGTIGFDSNHGWYSIRRDGLEVNIKDPFSQVRRNKYALRDKIESLPNWQGPMPTLGHAVAFPDGVADLKDLGPDSPRDIVLLHTDLENLERWTRDCLKFWAGDRFHPPGEYGVQALRRLLRKSWLMRDPRIGEEIGFDESAISHYTAEQFRILDFLAGRPRAAIRGCAGSGKTMLAIEKARRLADEGFDTLLTCYNRYLADEIRRSSPLVPRLKVQGFHALCQEYGHKTGRSGEPDWNDSHPGFFDEVMPDALAEAALSRRDELQFDAIVVDEGQDFRSTWWLALEMLLRDSENGVFYVFYDDNQLVYKRDTRIPVNDIPFALTVNCRNTRHIHNAFSGFYQSDVRVICRGPEGRPVVLQDFDGSQKGVRAALTQTLTHMVFVEEVRPEDIVVLSPGGPGRPPLAGMSNPGTFQLVDDPSTAGNAVYCTTIRKFKGLERPIVVLILPTEAAPDHELLYVGMSRARHHLHLILSTEINTEVKSTLLQTVAPS